MNTPTKGSGTEGAFVNSYSRPGNHAHLPASQDPNRARRKVQLALAVLVNLILVLMEGWANLALWQQHPVFKDLVIFYTHQSNFLALIASALFVVTGTVALFRDGRIPRLLKVFRLMCTVQLYITFIVVLVGLGPMTALAGGNLFAMYGGPMFVMHLMGPIVSLFSFVFLEGTPRLQGALPLPPGRCEPLVGQPALRGRHDPRRFPRRRLRQVAEQRHCLPTGG